MSVHTIVDVPSSLISQIYWNDESEELTVVFRKFYVPYFIHCGVTRKDYNKFIVAESQGNYYLSYIKNKFKIMDAPKGINVAKNSKRFINIRIDVTKINKNLIFAGAKGNYLDLCLHMLPDGEVDKYENLGFITQSKPKDSKEETAILGNARENEWAGGGAEASPGAELSGTVAPDDDLPF